MYNIREISTHMLTRLKIGLIAITPVQILRVPSRPAPDRLRTIHYESFLGALCPLQIPPQKRSVRA